MLLIPLRILNTKAIEAYASAVASLMVTFKVSYFALKRYRIHEFFNAFLLNYIGVKNRTGL